MSPPLPLAVTTTNIGVFTDFVTTSGVEDFSSSAQNYYDYMYMTVLARIYGHPRMLLRSYNLTLTRRGYLLRRWRDDRTRYLFEHGRDMDYNQDAEMQALLLAINDLKTHPRRYA